MRVAIVTNTSWNIYNFRLGLARFLKQRGHHVIAVAPEDSYSDFLKEEFEFHAVNITQKGKNPISDLGIIWQLYGIYQKTKPDCILHFTIKPNIYGSLAAAFAGIPCINTVSGLGTVFLHKGLVSSLAAKLYRLAFRFPISIIFQNDDDRTLFIERKLVKAEKTLLFPGSGVNIHKFYPVASRNSNSFTFLLVARLLKDKGIAEYAEAAKIIKTKYSDVTFLLAGGLEEDANLGIPLSRINAWEQEGLLKYIGFHKNVLQLLHEADCAVLPSYREGTPRSLLEAAAAGLPLLASDVPGCREVVVNGKNGFLFKAKNSQDLADKIEKLLTASPELIADMGIFSRKLAEERFSEEIVIDKYLNILENLIGKSTLH